MQKPSLLDQNPVSNKNSTDYKEILNSFGIENVIQKDFYFQVGEIEQSQGWIIHISIWDIHFKSVLAEIFPLLIKLNIPFFIPINQELHSLLQSGSLGYKNLGKIITIFPKNEINIVDLAVALISATNNYIGPNIPTDFHLGNLVYTKYGSFTINPSGSISYITTPNGEIIKDEEPIPPHIYEWMSWPFGHISAPKVPVQNRILNNKYFITKTLKPDVKGRIMKALYQKNIFTFKKCIIKEGKFGMGSDSEGREMKHRLQWQHTVYKNLKSLLPIPSIIDLFTENDNTYLVFEYINGKSWGEYLATLYNGNNWCTISKQQKIEIISKLIEIIKIINILHISGYVHRDLNVENIYIDKREKIWLMDFELSYDVDKSYPSPPFEKGTEGYMSPEQEKLLPPKIEQDIYSIGAVLIHTFTHITPYKFNHFNKIQLKKDLLFFIGDEIMTNLIVSCLDIEDHNRPKLNTLLSEIELYQERIQNSDISFITPRLAASSLDNLINKSLLSLKTRGMIDNNGYWTSSISTNDFQIGNLRIDRTIYLGYRKGLGGILLLIGKAFIEGYDLNNYKEIWQKNYKLLLNSISQNEASINPGLYKGYAGIALGFASLLHSKLIPLDKFHLELLNKCFDTTLEGLDLADGISGYGLAMLKCRNFLPCKLVEEKLKNCLNRIYYYQLKNGAWNYTNHKHKSLIITGYSNGIAGIIYFLLCYSDVFSDKKAKKSAIAGLNYLIKISSKIKGEYTWKIASNSKDRHDFSNGSYLILLPFIEAYNLTKNELYRKIVENTLQRYPYYVTADFSSIERGVAGLGLVYLRAWKAFENNEWFIRAEWIANLLLHTVYDNFDASFWLQFDPFFPSADLLTGNAGIIYFLLEFKHSKSDFFVF